LKAKKLKSTETFTGDIIRMLHSSTYEVIAHASR